MQESIFKQLLSKRLWSEKTILKRIVQTKCIKRIVSLEATKYQTKIRTKFKILNIKLLVLFCGFSVVICAVI